jgi:hypothetical protein
MIRSQYPARIVIQPIKRSWNGRDITLTVPDLDGLIARCEAAGYNVAAPAPTSGLES